MSGQLDAEEGGGSGRTGLRAEMRATARLGLPLALGELGWMSTYLVDALVIGRMPNSSLPIAASALGNSLYYALAFFVVSLLNGLETTVAQSFGRGDRRECVHLLVQSLWIVGLGTPVVVGAACASVVLLPATGASPEVAAETARYVHALAWSTPLLLAYMALRRWLQSVNRVGLVTLSLVVASPINLAADLLLVFGHFGVPALGLVGAAYATCIVRFCMFVVLVIGTVRAFHELQMHADRSMLAPSRARLRALLRIGWPTAIESCAELGVSTYLSILCARLGELVLAAHQVVLDLTAFTYQASAGLAYATVSRVGQSEGRRDHHGVRLASAASLWLGLGFMTVAATVFAAFAPFWLGFYTNSADVVRAASSLLVLSAFLLMGDTLFVLIASSLAGVGDTRTPLVVSVFWNWLVGMPLAYVLAFPLGRGLTGLWIGRAVGSVGAGLSLLYCWRRRLAREATSRPSRDARLAVGTSTSLR